MPRRNIHHELKVAEGRVVRLRHTTRQGDWRFYHYNGELPVVDSLLTIPADLPEVIQRAWIQGFRMTAEGRIIADLAKHIRAEAPPEGEEPAAPTACCSDECCQPETEELAALCCETEDCCADDDNTDCGCIEAVETPVEPEAETETAESEGDDDEGPADGGQPVEDDGVRSSEPDSDGSLPEGGDDGRDGGEPADRGDGDESAD